MYGTHITALKLALDTYLKLDPAGKYVQLTAMLPRKPRIKEYLVLIPRDREPEYQEYRLQHSLHLP